MFNIIEYLYLKQKNNLVYYDILTNVKSRIYYDKVATKKYIHKCIKIIYVDINNLKKVNDKFGHANGDRYIKSVSDELRNIEGLSDICRIGGDEFVIFCNPSFNHKPFDMIKNISYGIYIKKKDESINDAVNKADRLMYINKKKNKENTN